MQPHPVRHRPAVRGACVALTSGRSGHPPMMRRIAIADWIGSDNLGDEFLRALAHRIRARGAAPIHGRAGVLLDYSPEMASLAAEGGQWAPLITETDAEPARLVRGSRSAPGVVSRAGTAREALRVRLAGNDRTLDVLIP